MAPRKKEVEASVPAPAEDVSMEEVPAETEGETLMREDPHNPAAMMFQEQRLRIVRAHRNLKGNCGSVDKIMC